jgi:hypothetical protein
MNEKQQRNDLCACGSKKKYKKCCGAKLANQKQQSRNFFNPMQAVGAISSMKKHAFKVVSQPQTRFLDKPLG